MKTCKVLTTAFVSVFSSIFMVGFSGCIIDFDDPKDTVTVVPDTPSAPDFSKWVPDDSGTLEVVKGEGAVLKFENNNLFSIFADENELSVDSRFGNVVSSPRIVYIGEFGNIEFSIPIKDNIRDSKAEIRLHGGYMVKLTAYNVRHGGDTTYYIRLWLADIRESGNELVFQYDIFARGQ